MDITDDVLREIRAMIAAAEAKGAAARPADHRAAREAEQVLNRLHEAAREYRLKPIEPLDEAVERHPLRLGRHADAHLGVVESSTSGSIPIWQHPVPADLVVRSRPQPEASSSLVGCRRRHFSSFHREWLGYNGVRCGLSE
jgi:hypothetical protein